MRRFHKKIIMLILVMIMVITNISSVFADSPIYTNEENGYEAIIEDDANLVSDNEETRLMGKMKKITKYGNVAFHTSDHVSYSTSDYIESYYRKKFGTDSGTVFLIDMSNRNIWIFSDGKIYKTITKSYAEIITDNIYTYATDSDYYKCADKAFDQIYSLLNGERIAQPMRYIGNAILAIIIALIINYFIACKYSSPQKVNQLDVVDGMKHKFEIKDLNIKFIRQTRKYDPPSSSSSGGGGGGSSSGGGGGHSF